MIILDRKIGCIGKYIWPFILGVICSIIYFIATSFAFDVLQFISTIPVINLILLINVSFVGIHMIDVECVMAGAIVVVFLVKLCIPYDRYNDQKCKSVASWTCGVLLALLYIISLIILISDSGFSWQLFAGIVPYLLSIVFIIGMANE